MSEAAGAIRSPYLDDPGRRLLWIAPLALLLWAALLFGFSRILETTAAPPPELKAVEARIVEMPPPAGLQATPAHPIAAAAPKPKPQAVRKPAPLHHQRVRQIAPAPLPPSEAGTAKGEPAKPAPSSRKASATSAASNSTAGVAGVGNDSSGARAIYAPVPTIPEDLREESINTVAVAHFRVGYDGTVEVVLTQPTSNPRLNEILLDTLKQWRFFPAMRKGVAVDSEFDLRIPVSVQ